MDVVKIPEDRYAAHVFLAETLTDIRQDRDFQWRLIPNGGNTVALVRKSDEDIPIIPEGSSVSFSIEAIALKRTKGKRFYLLNSPERLMFVVGTLWANAGLMVDPESVTIIDSPGLIADKTSRFIKPAAYFQGNANVVDSSKLKNAIKNGIGQGKAYGYGLLLVEEI